MAVDYFYRLVVTGSPAAVQEFRRKLRRTVHRTVSGKHWRETVPFSFASLYELAPEAASRVAPTVPCDPYDMSIWPTKRLSPRKSQVRYAMRTRNMEFAPLLHKLARKVAGITFHLVSDCEGEIVGFQFSKGSYRQCTLPESDHEPFWDRARKKYGLVGEVVYEDDEARWFVEEQMRRAALQYWNQKSQFKLAAIRSWSGRPICRDLESEQTIAIAELNQEIDAAAAGKVPRRSRARGRE